MQPALAALLDFVTHSEDLRGGLLATRVKVTLPFTLGLVLAAVVALSWLVIHFTVGRPLERTEKAIEKLGRLELDVPLESGGPLLSRLQGAIARMVEAVQTERAITLA